MQTIPSIPTHISLDAMRAACQYGEALGRAGAELPDAGVMGTAPGWWRHQVTTGYFGGLGQTRQPAAE